MQERARLEDIHAAVEAAKKQAEEAAAANAAADRLAALHQAAETLEKEEKEGGDTLFIGEALEFIGDAMWVPPSAFVVGAIQIKRTVFVEERT